MVKARSIDVSLKPTKAYELVANKLKEQKLKIVDTIDLVPYERITQQLLYLLDLIETVFINILY